METLDMKSTPEMLHNNLVANFRHAFHHFWPAFLGYYAGIFDDVHRRVHFAKSHALIDAVIAARVAEVPAEVIFGSYKQFISTEPWSHNLQLNTKNEKYFWRVIRRCRLFGISQTIVHGNCDPHGYLRRELSAPHKRLIRQFFTKKSMA